MIRANNALGVQIEEQAIYDINMIREDPSLPTQVNGIIAKSAGDFSAQAQGNANLPRMTLVLKAVAAKGFQKIKSAEE